MAPSARALKSAEPWQLDPDDAPKAVAAWDDTEPEAEQLKNFDPFEHYKPHEKQRLAHGLFEWLGKRVIILGAGRRGGKNVCAAGIMAQRMLYDFHCMSRGLGHWEGKPKPRFNASGKSPEPFGLYWGIAPIYSLGEEQRIQLQKFLGLAKEGGLIVSQAGNDWWLRGGIKIEWKTADDPKKLVSRPINGAWGDEWARVKPELWRDSLQPGFSDTLGWFLATSTPLGRNHFWRDLVAKADPIEAAILAQELNLPVEEILDSEYGFFRWTTADNTALPHLAAEMAKMRSRMPLAMWERNYKASFTAFVGQVFSFLRMADHFRKPNVTTRGFRKIVAGKDYGFSPHPGSISVVGETYDGEFVELETVTKTNVVIDSDDSWRTKKADVWTVIAWELQKCWGWSEIFLPHDNPQNRVLFMKRFGTKAVKSAYTSHRPALDWFRMALWNKDLSFNSLGAWNSILSLRHPETGSPETQEDWVKEGDDAFDSVRYALSDVIRLGKLRSTQGNAVGYSTVR